MSRFAGRCAALVLSLTPSLGLGADTPPRVAVVCIGDDPVTTGACQREVETRFVAPKFALRDAPDLAASIASRTPPADPSDPSERRRAAEMLEAGAKAYYDDKLVDALDRLAAVQALHERASGISTDERIKLLLWRTAVFLALGDRPKAEAEARGALILSPSLQVDLSVFRPSVKSLVDEIRAAGLPSATILFSGTPPGADVKIDGRPVTDRMQVPLGRHRLVARAPGFLEVERSIEVSGDASIPLAMPLFLDPHLEKLLVAIAEKGVVSADGKRTLDRVAEKARVDAVVLALVRTRATPADARVLVYWRASLAPSSAGTPQATSVAAIADLAFARADATAPAAIAAMRKLPGAVAARTPAPPPPPSGERSRLALAARGDIAIVSRERAVDSEDGAGFSSGFVGIGPRVAVDLSRGTLIGEVEGSFVSYSLSTLDVNLPDGGRSTVTGGSTVAARAGAGVRWPARESIALVGLAGIAWEAHRGDDIRDGGAVGLFPSETRIAIDVRGAVHADVSRFTLVAGAGLSPWSQTSEAPSGTTGRDPSSAIAPSWQLGAHLEPRRGWNAGLVYEGELRTTTYSGAADLPLDPPLTDVSVRQTLHTVVLTLRRSF